MTIKEENEILVENIRSLCKEKGTNLTELEKHFGWGNGTIGKWANAKKQPNYERVLSVAEFFNVNISFLRNKDEKMLATNSSELTKEEKEIIRLFRAVDPATRLAMLQLLRAAEAGQSFRGGDGEGK